ncbi:unnamed protein product [Microthlaspi erraticum]|uniref:Arabidopsis retrotransposon Orf1 C-terminal domain-containing protein n=1 Tax=Microthlaspi erraticum TaxID=1685480 RepID=A0A6D2KM69_9BRAS|nr:unnamed protein product [Microthlaspi erraticum]
MHLAKFFSHTWKSYKELTCEFLASMRYHMYDEEDRADLDQGLGWITFLAKGEKRMVTFRQLGDLVWVQLWRRDSGTSRKRNSKGFGLQSLMECTLPQGPRQLRSGAQCLICAQGTCQHLLCKESTGQSMRGTQAP